MKINIFTAGLLVLASLSTATVLAADPGKTAVKPKLSMQQAEKLALKAYEGTIVKRELEQEKGGSGLRYSFDIKRGEVVHEVGIDAVTGAVLENSVDNDKD